MLDIFGNDSDEDLDPLVLTIVSNPAHGSLGANIDGTFLYVPVASFFGADTFTYVVNDGTLFSREATVRLELS